MISRLDKILQTFERFSSKLLCLYLLGHYLESICILCFNNNKSRHESLFCAGVRNKYAGWKIGNAGIGAFSPGEL